MITVSIDASQLKINAKNLEKAMMNGVPKALLDAGHELMRLSQIEVPHDEGTLQNSGVVETDGNDVIVGYHTPYAARLHEHPEYRFRQGRKGKYLEDPVRNNQEELGIKSANFMRKVVKDGTK